MAEAYIIDAARSPTGKNRGSLKEVHAADLGAHVIQALVERNPVPDEDYDDVIFGAVDQLGSLAGDVARTCWLAAGYSERVPGVTIDRQCGSSQQAVHFAAQAVMAGVNDIVIAGGVQTMSRIPIQSAVVAGQAFGFNNPFTDSSLWVERYGEIPPTQYRGAQMLCEQWGFSREELEVYSLESHRRAAHAIQEGYFDREIVPFGGFAMDETVRETSLDKMAGLETVFGLEHITAAVSSPVCDGSSAMLIASETAVEKYSLTPRARIHHMSVRADDPMIMLTAPISATRYALERAQLKLEDIDLVEINEAFAPVPLAWLRELGFPHEKTNVNGGAIALGHPIGATGTKLMCTLLHELERSGGRFGLQTMCEGGGQANVTIIERL
jgi:acetyl-CoA C-acetyltransferase